MTEEQTLLRRVLLQLWRSHDRWSRGANGPIKDLYNRLLVPYPRISEEELARLTGHKCGNLGRAFLFLVPPPHSLVQPILHLSYDFRVDIPILRIRIAMFGLKSGKPSAVGFRFETPEAGETHNYYHSQMIEDLVPNRGRLPCQEWLPQRCPALTLNAVNAMTLLLSLLFSLYDRAFEGELESNLRHSLAAYLRDMHWSGEGQPTSDRILRDGKGRWRLEPH